MGCSASSTVRHGAGNLARVSGWRFLRFVGFLGRGLGLRGSVAAVFVPSGVDLFDLLNEGDGLAPNGVVDDADDGGSEDYNHAAREIFRKLLH